MKTFKEFSGLGPKATKAQDTKEIARQKSFLANKAKEYHDQSEREAIGGAAKAKGISFELAKKNIKEDGVAGVAAPASTVASVAGSGDSRLPATQREPGVGRTNPVMGKVRRRKPPQM